MPLHQAQVSILCAVSWGLLWGLSATPTALCKSMHVSRDDRYMQQSACARTFKKLFSPLSSNRRPVTLNEHMQGRALWHLDPWVLVSLAPGALNLHPTPASKQTKP